MFYYFYAQQKQIRVHFDFDTVWQTSATIFLKVTQYIISLFQACQFKR